MISKNKSHATEPSYAIPRIYIFDTTLRDGDQASGFNFFPHEKISIAHRLADLGVDIIEAGFGVSSTGDSKTIRRIAREVGKRGGPIICSLSRAVDKDIEAAAKAVERAYKPRIHTFIATSDIHVQDKFKRDRNWVLEKAVAAVKKAKGYVDDVEFSTEDFGRSDLGYIVDVVREAIKAGATTINLPDTVGWTVPKENYERVKYVIEKIRREGLDAIFSVHNHNDLGLATANTLSGILAGARQIEVTMNGIGERAGNSALEEIVAILKERNIAKTGINTRLIGPTSKLVSEYTGVTPTPNKAVVGSNAFKHEAGIHQDGVLKKRETYEIMNPDDYGVDRGELTLGPRSGSNAVRQRYNQMGIKMNDEEFSKVFMRFKRIADGKKKIDDADLILALKGKRKVPKVYRLTNYIPTSTNGTYASMVAVEINGKPVVKSGIGDGQIDAGMNAIKQMFPYKFDLENSGYVAQSTGFGSAAQSSTEMTFRENGWRLRGHGVNNDVVRSSLMAAVDGCNRMKYVSDYFARRKANK